MASDNLTPEDVRHILKSNRSEAVNAINRHIGSLLDYLIEDYAISTEVCDRIKAEKIPQDRAREFLDHVSSVGEKAFLSFKRGLKETLCDSLLQAIEAEEQKVKKQRRKTKRRQRASWPEPAPSNPPLRRPKSLTVRNLTTYFEASDTSAHSEHYSGRASNDDGRGSSEASFTSGDMHASPKSFKGIKHVQQRFQSGGTTVAGSVSSVACSTTSDLSEDDAVPDTTTVKQVAASLNDLNIGLNASSVCSNTPQIKPVNMLLVGCKENGKSSTGNSILGEKCFMSKRRGGTSKASLGSGSFQGECEDVQWDVNVVDTPGISQEMSRLEFKELVSGVKMLQLSDEGSSQKTSGLDAIVLIWSYDHTDRNVEVEVQAFQSLHRLFGDDLYKYLVIAVTHARYLSSVEDYIQELPESLRQIEKKCSGRLVTFENTLEDIQQSREELCNTVYDLSKKNQYRYTAQDLSPLCKIPKGDELRLALMGKTGVGKSSTGNSIIGCEKFPTSVSAASETTGCPYYTRKKPRKVAVVDSPGVLCTDSGVCEKDRLVDQLSRIAAIYNTGGLHAMLLVLSGRQRFIQEDKDTVQYLRTVFGDRLLRHYTIIAITGKDDIESDKKFRGDVETYLRNAPLGLQEVLKLCQHRVVFFNNKTNDETIQRMQLAELIRKIDGLVQRNDGPYIDENFKEGKDVAGNIEARSTLSTKSKSTSQLPVTSRSLTPFPFPDEKSRSEERILLPSSERHPGSSTLQTRPKQPLRLSFRAMSISGLPTRSISPTSFLREERCFSEGGIPLPGEATESDVSDDETFTSNELVSVRNQTPISVAEDQLRPSDVWQRQKSLDDSYIGARASPLFVRRSEGTFQGQNVTDPGITEERVRHVAALSNLRLTKLWQRIRRRLRLKRNLVGPKN